MFKIDHGCVHNTLALNQLLLGKPLLAAYKDDRSVARESLKCTDEQLDKLLALAEVEYQSIDALLATTVKIDKTAELVKVFLNFLRLPEYSSVQMNDSTVMAYKGIIPAGLTDTGFIQVLLQATFTSITLISVEEPQRISDGTLFTCLDSTQAIEAFKVALGIRHGVSIGFPGGFTNRIIDAISISNDSDIDYKFLLAVCKGFKRANISPKEFGKWFAVIPDLLLSLQGKTTPVTLNSAGNFRVLVPKYSRVSAKPKASYCDITPDLMNTLGLSSLSDVTRLYVLGGNLKLGELA